MRLFLKKTIFYFTIWLAFSTIVDFFVTRTIRGSSSRAIRVWEDVLNSKINEDIIILGSSRACDHYNPAVFDSITGFTSYNLGQHGKKIDMDILRYNIFKKYAKHQPKIIIWDVHGQSICFSDGWYDGIFTPYLYKKEIWSHLDSPQHDFNIFDRIIPLYRYWKKPYIFNYAFKNARNDANPYKGYVGEGGIIDTTATKLFEANDLKCTIDSSILASFKNTLLKMRNDGSFVVLVYSPLYYKGVPLLIGTNEVVSTYQRIANETGSIFINYLQDSICKNERYFTQYVHLNKEGANVFSNNLAKRLIPYINQQ